jgi:hypothetical protein
LQEAVKNPWMGRVGRDGGMTRETRGGVKHETHLIFPSGNGTSFPGHPYKSIGELSILGVGEVFPSAA